VLCILYVIITTACLAAAALLAEHAMPARWPRRGVWCAVIVMSLVAPPVLKARHAIAISRVLPSSGADHGSAVGVLTSVPLLDARWWAATPAWTDAIYRIWLVTSGVLALWAAAHAWRVRRTVRASSSETRVEGVPVVLTSAVGPATVGVWRPRVVIPSWVLALPERQRRFVIRHEQEHERARDGVLVMLSAVAVVLTPWNLPLYWMQRRLRTAVEIDCDRRVVRTLGEPETYAEMLYRIADATRRAPTPQPALMGARHALEYRLRMITSPAGAIGPMRWAGVMTAIVLALGILLLPHPVVAAHTPAPSPAPQARP
jgi:hypothetical protein